MATSTDALIDSYLDQAKAPQAAPAPAAAPTRGQRQPDQQATRGRTAPVNIDALIDSHLDQQKSPDFTKQQPPAEAPSAVGKVSGAVYGATLGPLVNRAREGGKQIAGVLVPAPGDSSRAVPSRNTGTSDVVRSRMERPGVWQDVKDVAGGALKIASSPLAPLGEAARPGGEFIGRKAGRTDEQLKSDLARAKSEKALLSKSDPLYKQGTEQQYDAQIAKLERQIAMGPEQREKETGQAAAEGAELLGGLLLPGAGITPKLAELVPGLKVPLTVGRAARGPLALAPEVRDATAGLAARGGEDAGLFTGQVPRDPRMVELPKAGPLRPQPAGVSETLGKAEEALTGGARGTQREGTRSTLAAAEEMATGKRLDLGKAGRRVAAQRGTYQPPRISTDPAPELQRFDVKAVDEAGQPVAPVTPPSRGLLSSAEVAAEPVQTAEDFSRELFPSVKRGPLATRETPISVPEVTPTNGVLDHLRDETGHLNIGAYVDAAEATATKLRKKLPQEEFVRRVRPNSPVITEVERFEAGLADKMRETFATPTSIRKGVGAAVGKPVAKTKWWDHVREMDPTEINRLEEQAVREWEAGGQTPAALNQAIARWPQALKDYVEHRNAALQGEQAARRYLGLDPIPETPGPYLPRMTDAEAKDIANAGGHLGVGHGLQTTVKGAQHERVFATQLEGEAAGIPYIDRRNAFIQREMNSLKLRHTAQLIKNMEERGGLFRTKAAAEAASPTGQAFAVQGLPGSKLWYTATEPERTFIVQNLTEKGGSSIIHFQNVLLRNPNLVNPAPHAVKNMGAKYLLARGPQGIPGLAKDVVEFSRNSNPALIQEFKQMMPYAEAGEPAFSTLRHATVQGPGVGRAVKEVEDALGLLNKGSSKEIFKWADPAMRYSLYKYYRTVKGMAPQEAANNAWIDLVRYGTRSDMTDWWKKIPLNMFIPWRVGTVTSLIKQVTTHPVRTALTIGAIDYMREMRYRQTGRWTHMPWDYAEGPIAATIDAARKGDLAALSSTALITAAFGPGGEFAAKNLEDWIHGIRTGQGVNSPDFKALVKIFWGMSQIGDGGKEWMAYQRDGQSKHLVNIMTGLLVGERGALEYQPKRLQSALPQSLPGQQKDVRVQAAEDIQDQRQAQQQKRSRRHKGQTITERVGG